MKKIFNIKTIDKFWYGALFISAVIAGVMVLRIAEMSNAADQQHEAKLRVNENRIVALEAEVSVLKEVLIVHLKGEKSNASK